MNNYKLLALSIHVNGRVYLKEEGFIFNEKNTNPIDLKNAIEKGFLEKTLEVDETVDGKAEATISTGVTVAIATSYINTLETVELIDSYILGEERKGILKAAEERKKAL